MKKAQERIALIVGLNNFFNFGFWPFSLLSPLDSSSQIYIKEAIKLLKNGKCNSAFIMLEGMCWAEAVRAETFILEKMIPSEMHGLFHVIIDEPGEPFQEKMVCKLAKEMQGSEILLKLLEDDSRSRETIKRLLLEEIKYFHDEGIKERAGLSAPNIVFV